MKLSGLQIAAAITLSGLTREALATEAGIGRNTLDRIINETAACREDTIRKVTDILETRGIEFLPGEGVRKKDRIVTTLDGKDCLRELVIDVYETLRASGGGEMLIAHLDEGSARQSLQEDFLKEQIKKRREAGITSRLLVRADDPHLIPPYDTYRAIPNDMFSPYPFYIYGGKLALLSWEPLPRVIIIDDERFAESARKLFNIVWETATKISKKE